MNAAPDLFSHRPYWAHQFGVAPTLPTTREEMDALGWDSCDVVVVTGDAYVDHPSFGAGIIGRLLEAHGFRVGILPQPDWQSAEPFRALGRPNLMFGVTSGNMDSMVNRYTSEGRLRSDDAYTAGGEGGARPDRSVVVYSQRCREAFGDVPVVLGGIEASLRRIAHFDYWSDKVRRSVLLDARADMLLYGNAERAIVEVAHHLGRGRDLGELRDLRGTAYRSRGVPEGWAEIDVLEEEGEKRERGGLVALRTKKPKRARARTVVRLPSHQRVIESGVSYANASRYLHLEANPGNARALVQDNGDWDVWINPPPIPLTTGEMDRLFELPFSRVPHPRYRDAKIPAYEMIRFSVTAIRGCFGGCTFCSITEHEGRIIQSRSESSILREIGSIRDRTPGFTGVISDIGGPTANMYRLGCKSPAIESACRKPSCIHPGICDNLNTDHAPLVQLYEKARALPGVKKILIASGVRYDLAIESPEYVRELARHHVGGYLKIAPEHVAEEPLRRMKKPGIGSYHRFKELFDRYSEEAGKKQYLIPYFIAAHPGTRDEDMVELALWLKREGYRLDQVQAFLPSPMASATAMYHTGLDPFAGVRGGGEVVEIPKGRKRRRLHKALLRYHDPGGWPEIRAALKRMGREDLIGPLPTCLVPRDGGGKPSTGERGGRGPRRGAALTQHSGLPPRDAGGKRRR